MAPANFVITIIVAFAFAGLAWADNHSEHQSPATQAEDKEQCPKKKSDDKCCKFTDMDTDNNGSISFDEFKAHHEQKLKDKFAKIDSDGNGSISQAELDAKHERIKEMREMHDKEMSKNKKDKKSKKD